MIQVGAGERVRRRGRDGRGRHVVHGLQCRSAFDTSLSAGARGHPQGRRRDSEPGLGHKQRQHKAAIPQAPTPVLALSPKKAAVCQQALQCRVGETITQQDTCESEVFILRNSNHNGKCAQ